MYMASEDSYSEFLKGGFLFVESSQEGRWRQWCGVLVVKVVVELILLPPMGSNLHPKHQTDQSL
jgi:hypothetical protein